MKSCIYRGSVVHRRHEPRPHAFRYRLIQVYLDLDELSAVFAGRWLWGVERRAVAAFHRADHFGDPREPLRETVSALVERETGARPRGAIRLLTGLRVLGYCFNPVSFYYCFDPAGERVETVVADVTNTPWKERHQYVVPALRHASRKAFHVSPFLPMDMEYRWRLGEPGRRLGIHLESRRGGRRVFDAALALERAPITGPNLARALVAQPLGAAKVIAAIYFEALRLRVKGAPFHPHPQDQETARA